MEVLLEIICTFLIEALLEIVGALLAAKVERRWPKVADGVRKSGPRFGRYAIAGFCVGLLSIAVIPGPAPIPRWGRIASLVALPLVSGFAVAAVGSRRDRSQTRIRFYCGVFFGVGYAACRFLFAWARVHG